VNKPLLIIGASTRAAIHSARRAGFTPFAIDLFCDEDARRFATMSQCELADYPQGFIALAKQFPPMPWMYTGGLENAPEAVAAISAERELVGNGIESLKLVRDPFAVAKWNAMKNDPTSSTHLLPLPLWERAGVRGLDSNSWCDVNGRVEVETPHPGPLPQGEREQVGSNSLSEVCATTQEAQPLLARRANGRFQFPTVLSGLSACPEEADGWLCKPLRGSGGFGITSATTHTPSGDVYLQRRVEGTSCSAVFQNNMLLGATEQLIGTEYLHAKPWQYAGNLGPITPPDGLLELAEALSTWAGLQGTWGVDYIQGDVPWLIEINPRYTASVEVLEHAAMGEVVGKGIYYAPHSFVFPAHPAFERAIEIAADPWAMPEYADIPSVGTPIESGQPVLTTLVRASSLEECREAIKQRAAELDRLFAGAAT
jgi:uncharacterized protein